MNRPIQHYSLRRWCSLVRVYLVQHGEAKRTEEDPERPLTEKGLRDVQKLGMFAEELGLKVDQIFHSGKLRAKQTAKVLHASLLPAKELSETEGLNPEDSPAHWRDRLKSSSHDLMLVGHLPHLSKLASLLVADDADREIVSFRNAGLVCLEKAEGARWRVLWVVAPDIIL